MVTQLSLNSFVVSFSIKLESTEIIKLLNDMKLSKEIYVMGTFTVKDSKGKEYSLWELSTLKKDKVEKGQKFYKDTSVRRTAIQGLTNTTEDATTKRNSMRDDDIIIDDIIVPF